MKIIIYLLALYGLKCLLFGTRRTEYKIKIKQVAAPNLPKGTIEFSDPNGGAFESVNQ